MGPIKYTKDQALTIGYLKQENGKINPKDSKQQEKKTNKENPKYFDGDLNPRKNKGKKQKMCKLTYSDKGWNHDNACMKKTINMMA